MIRNEEKLDNPVWYSLQQTHKTFSIPMENICFYDPDFCPFGGFIDGEDVSEKMEKYGELASNFYVVGQKPAYSNFLKISNELICDQMLLETRINCEEDENI